MNSSAGSLRLRVLRTQRADYQMFASEGRAAVTPLAEEFIPPCPLPSILHAGCAAQVVQGPFQGFGGGSVAGPVLRLQFLPRRLILDGGPLNKVSYLRRDNGRRPCCRHRGRMRRG